MTHNNWWSQPRRNRSQRRAADAAARKTVRPELTQLEDRTTPVNITAAAGSLTIDIDNSNEVVTFNSGAADSISVNSTNPIIVNGVPSGTSTTFFSTTSVTVGDSGTGTGVTFNTSAAAYQAAFAVTLDNNPGTVQFNGSSAFGSNNLNVTTARNIVVGAGAAVTAGSGNISLSANAATSTAGNFAGITVSGAVTGGAGTVSLSGKGGDDGGGNQHGVLVTAGASVGSSGAGAVGVTGTGGASIGSNNHGVVALGTSATITSSGGGVTVQGTGGGSGASGFNYGVYITSGQITAGSSGTVGVTGTGGASVGANNYGVFVEGASSTITSSGGAVSVTGLAGSGSNNVATAVSAGSITSGSNAPVTVTADSVDILSGGTVSAGAGTVTLRTRTPGTKIDLGGANVLSGSPLTLGLTDAELDQVTAGTLVIGGATAGDLDVTSNITRPGSTAMQLVSGDNINVTGGQVNTGGGTLLLTPGTLSAEGVAPTKSATDSTASALSFTSGSNLKIAITGTTVDTQYTQLNVSGGVTLTGANLSLSGAYTPVPLDVFTIVSATSVTGTFNGLANNAIVNFNGQNLRVNYTATTVTLTAIATLSVAVDGGGNLVLTDVSVAGTNDDLTITKSGANFVITSATQEFGNTIPGGTLSNGNKTLTLTPAAFSGGVIFDTAGGSDTVSVDYSGGRIGRAVTFNGGTGTTDKLRLVRGTSTGVFNGITHTFANASDGSVTLTNGANTDTVNYTGLEPVSDNLDAVNRVFQFSGAADAVVLQSSGVGGFDLNIDSNAAEAVDFVSPTGSLTIRAGSGDDTVTVSSVTNFTAALVADGEGGTDSISQNATLALGNGAVTGNVSLTAETVDVNGAIDTTGGTTDGTVTLTGGTVTVDAAVTAGGGNVAVIATGTATQTAAMTGTGLVLGTGGNAGTYTLTSAGNNFATLQATTTAAVNYRDSDGLDLAGVNVGGNVNLTVGGTLSDSAASVVGGTFSLTAGSNSAVLDVATNNFATLAVVSAANVTLVDTNGVIFGTSNLTGTLQVTAGGAITQSGDVNAALLNAAGTSVDLSNTANTVTTVTGSASTGSFSFTNDAALAVNPVSAVNGDVTLRTTAGAITLNGNVAAGTTVTLNAFGGGSQAGGTAITGANLLLLSSAASATFTLTNIGNNVGTLAANLSGAGSNLQYTDANALTVGTVGATNGVTTNGGTVTIATVNGNLAVTQAVTTTTRQTVLLTAGGANSTLSNSGTVFGGPVTLTADRMALGAPVNSAGFLATLVPFSANRLIDLGSGTDVAANTLELSTAELNQVTASELRVGNATTGNITVSAAVAPAGTGVLSLVTGAGVVNGGGSITETDLRITAVSGIGDGSPLNIDAGVLTFTNSTSGTARFAEANTTTVNTSANATRGVTFASGRFNIGLGQTLTASLLTVTAPTTLGGTGTVAGAVRNLGTTAPGFSPGILNVTGNYTFASNSSFEVEVGGPAAGNTVTDHDQLNVTGTVNIEANSSLNPVIFGGFAPAAGHRYVIVNNDGTDAVIGAFAGLGEGAVFSFGDIQFLITYKGNDGNDVVLVANQTPAASFTTAPTTGNEGAAVTFVGSFTDADGAPDAPFTYAYSTTASNGQSVAGASGTVSAPGALPAYTFTPNDDGTYTVTLTVTDRFGGTSTVSTVLTVSNVAPAYTAPADQTGSEGTAGTFTLGTFTDPAGALDGPYTVTVNWGDASSTTFTVAAPGDLGTRTYTYADDGSYTVTVTVAEAGGTPTGSGTFTVTVANVAPTVTINGPSAGLEASALNYTSTVTDPGSPEVFTYAWSVTKDGAAFGAAGSAATYSFTPDDNATYEVSLTVTDGDGGSTTAAKTVVVSNVIPSAVSLTPSNAAPNEGQAITLAGTFADPGTLDTHTVVINWGDGATTTVTLAAGVLTFPAQSHTYADDGTYTAVVTVTDKDGGQATGTQTFTVANVAPVYTAPATQAATEGSVGTFTLGTFTDPAGVNDGPYEVTVNWGDGNTESFTVTTPGTLGTRNHTYADGDPTAYTVTVTVAEAGGAPTSSGTFTVTVSNVAPAVTLTGPATGPEGSSVTFNGSFTDPAGALDGAYTYTYSVVASNGQVVSPATGPAAAPGSVPAFTFTPNDNGTYTVTLTVTETGGSPISTASVTLTVDNVAPTITSFIVPATGTEGTAVALSATATDPAGAQDPLTYSWLVTGPNAFSATLTGPSVNFTPPDDGTYTVTLTVTDGDGGTATQTGTVVVANVAPAVTINGPVAGVEAAALSYTSTVTDPGSPEVFTYAWSVTKGGAAFGAAGTAATYSFTPDDNATYELTLTVTDGDGGSTTATKTVVVSNVLPSAVTLTPSTATPNEGQAVTLGGSFADPGTLDTHTVVIAWGDGATTTVTLAAGVTSFPAQAHTYADDGTYTATVTVTDKDGGQATGTQTFTVANVAPVYTPAATQAATEGSVGTFTLGTFTDPAGAFDGPYEVTVNWGDGSPVESFSVAGPGSLGTRNHTYADGDPTAYTVTVTVAEAGGTPTSSGTFTVNVANVAPAYTAPSAQTANEGASMAFALGSFTDPAGGLDGPYTVTVDWGDGSADDVYTLTTPGALNPRTHTYADNGTYTVTVDVAEVGGPTGSGTFTVTVANVAPAVAINGPGSGVEGTGLNYMSTVTDPAGANDPLTYAWSVTKDGAAFGAAGALATFSFTPDDNATYEVTLTVTDGDGGSTTVTKTVNVSNVAPALTSPANVTVNEGVAVAFGLGSFTDPAGTFDAPYLVMVTWGDGNTETFSVAAPGSLGSGTHTYADNGTYTVTVAVTDDDGATRQTTFTVTVNNVAPANVTANGPYTMTEGGTVTLTGSATDVPADTLTYEWDLDGDGIYGETGGAAARGGELGQTVTYNAAGLDGPSTQTVSLRVRDEDGGLSAPVSTTVGVTNVAPTLTDIQVTSTIGENGTVTLTGTYTDPGTLDTHTLTVNWGDGNTETFAVSGGTFSRTHQYLDDTPTGTAGDVYVITATLADDDGGVSAARTDTVFVNNLAPQFGPMSVTPRVDENGTVTLTGSYTDVGTLDTHSVTVIWGDGSTETFTVTGGSFTRTHQYVDDGVSGDPAFIYVINVTLTDDDGGFAQVLTQTQVDNVAPTITAASVSASTEAGVATLTGTYTDPGTLDTHTLTINWGDGTTETFAVTGGSFTFTHSYTDDNPTSTPSDSYTVSLTLRDDDTGTTAASRTAVVNNAAPVLGPLTVTPAAVTESQSVTLSGSYTDAGALDTHSVTVNWGDGTTETFAVSGGTFSRTHTYADDPAGSPDDYTVTVTVTDDDTGTATATAVVGVANVAPTVTAFNVPASGVAESPITVSATATDPAGSNDPLTYTWEVVSDDGTRTTGGGQTFTFTPPAAGGYTVTLTVTDGDGGTANAQAVVVAAPKPILPPPPVAVYSVGGTVWVVNQPTGQTTRLVPFPGFLGAVTVASADLNGDRVPDVVVGAGAGGGPHVRVFDGASGMELASFFAFDPAFRGGVFVAATSGQIVVGAGAGGGPHVKVIDFARVGERRPDGVIAESALLANFFAFDVGFTGGVSVAAADVNGDGVFDVVMGAGAGGGPHVKVIDGTRIGEVTGVVTADAALLANFMAFDPTFTGGVSVAASFGQFAVGAGAGAQPQVKVYDSRATETANFFAFDAGFTGGVRVAYSDFDVDGDLDLVTAAGPGGGPHVKAFALSSLLETLSVFAADPFDPTGVFVG